MNHKMSLNAVGCREEGGARRYRLRRSDVAASIVAGLLFGASTAHAVMGFSELAPLDPDATSDMLDDYGPRVESDGAGNWITVWYAQDHPGGMYGLDMDIFVSRSTDDGITWTAPTAVDTNATHDFRNDTDPKIATDRAGTWFVVWTSEIGFGGGGPYRNPKEIVFASSVDDGVSWTRPRPIDTGIDQVADSPQVATDSNGHLFVVWEAAPLLDGSINGPFIHSVLSNCA